MQLTSWLTSLQETFTRRNPGRKRGGAKRRKRRSPLDIARQAELLQLRTMLSSVTFDFGSGDLVIDLDGSDSATAQVTSDDKVQISINGSPDDEMPDTSDVYSITVTAGDGGHLIDLSGLQPVDFAYLPIFATITTGAGDDTVTGTGMMDTIDVGDGDDHITGGLGEDTLSGGDGWDSIFGGDDNDELWSGSGVSGGGTSALDGGEGDDLLDGNMEETGDSSPPGDTGDDSLPGDTGERETQSGTAPVFVDSSSSPVGGYAFNLNENTETIDAATILAQNPLASGLNRNYGYRC